MCLAVKSQASRKTRPSCDHIALSHRWGHWRRGVQRLANVLQVVPEDSAPKYFWDRFCSVPFTSYFFLWNSFLSFLYFTPDFSATQSCEFAWLQVQKAWDTMTWKRRPEVKRVTKPEEQTSNWMSLPHTGLWWDSRGCMRRSAPQTTPAPSHTSCLEQALFYSGTRLKLPQQF